MEALYAKLYDKYNKLKRMKESEMEQFNDDTEGKLKNHIDAADELIEHLSNEKDRLCAQINHMEKEITSIRSFKAEQIDELQKLLMEEIQKSKELSEEVERLCNLQREGLCCRTNDACNEIKQLKSPSGGNPVSSRDLSSNSVKTLQQNARTVEALTEDNRDVSYSSVQVRYEVPECCRRDSGNSDGEQVEPASCLFQALVECLVGMKFSAVNQKEGLCVSALHQSSGYSFSLTWINKPAGEETQLLYRVLSLGTFERVAPDWMREVMMFSMNMCPIFFERVAKVLRLHH
ncbi:uncharacterized protein LOC122089159 [Macadamia integrifolia]|uniref:uncharacterized protein LOC122089159 n=1 Tax=Macadamia integrifolia TaxID=60698 RepID=UPI001C4FA62F|nr:uncharacterized protein LOC122089159 [Macadamia integrifolia]XP_042514601.1 uncharacterized protein LOC122089159 [Macadamia integrifolia]XP_042514602.1 uncharacterized protein LOC122089159 [Macadamia integrifolia]XP_042514603.1 uncharacterized protein LOC122089159 [Macadamia integrifolia]